jgi:membrane protein
MINLKSLSKYIFERAMEERVPDAAAAAAYYSFFSLFPLLLLVISIGSYFFDIEQVRNKVLNDVLTFIPSASQRLITRNINHVIIHRQSIGVIGILGLVWGASGVFNIIQDNLSRAWPAKPRRNLLKGQLFSILMVGAFFILLILFSIFEATMFFIFRSIENVIGSALLISILSRITMYIFILLIFWALYRWVPSADIRWDEALSGAVFSTITTQIFTAGFAWFLSSGLNKYNLVYGSLGTLVAFLFWLLVMNLLVLLGGHVSSAVAHENRGYK